MEFNAGTIELMRALLGRVEDGSSIEARLRDLRALQGELLMLLDGDVLRWLDTIPPATRDAAGDLYAGGGKRLRPLLAMLCGAAVAGEPARALPVATAVELLHTGTLLHDDVVDEGEIRRGKPTARRVWGNALAVLSGDFCYFAALDALLEHGDLAILQRAMKVARALSEGELIQLQRRGRADLGGEEAYMRVIDRKTASLFAFATWGGARCAGLDGHALDAFDTYGRKLGLAFQVVDDILDFAGDPASFGKALGHDVAEGTVTLPLAYAMEIDRALARDVERLVADFAQGRPSEVDPASVVERVCASPALARSRDTATRLTREAIDALGDMQPSPHVEALRTLAASLVKRVG